MFYRLKSFVAFFKIIIYNKLYLTCIWLVLIYDLLEERRVDDITIKKFFLIPYSISRKTNRFHVAVRLSSNWSKKTLKCDMVLWSAITSSLMPGCWKQESDAGDVTTQTFVNQEFARASITREKKNKACTMPEFIKSAYTFVIQERILQSWKISWGKLILQKTLKFLICFCFTPWLGQPVILLSSIIYHTG